MKKNKRLGKISQKTITTIPNPFDVSSHKTERTATAILMHWMRQIIEKQNLNLGLPDIETGGGDHRFPDTVIYKTQRSQDILCVLEFKPPFWDPFREDDPKEPARKKATSRHAKYFVTSNFRELILWNTEKANAAKPEEEQIINRYHLSEIYDLNFIEEGRYKVSIINALEKFLNDLYELSTGVKAEPRLAIDELLIWRLQEKINKLAYYYQDLIYNEAHKDKNFAKSLAKWFNNQGWNFYIENEDDYQKVARQTAYLLVNKILFYNALQLKRPDKLPPLQIPDDITQGGILKGVLQSYFNAVLKIDYETIYTTDFIDIVAFPDSREVVNEIKELVNVLRRYDFSTLGFDVIGRIFERLIPETERHNLGQYFTNPDIVDLILQFCVQHENDKIFDPACGAGTFLVRAYQLKKLINQRLSHEEILDSLWGNDIAKFPAHLTTINLAINDLSVEKNYPRVIQKDFFDLLSPGEEGFQLPEDVRKVLLKTMDKEELKILHPRWFDAIVGNPPYTRQEEISEISGEVSYKEKLIEKALTYGAQNLASISKRAGIYAYFFIHGAKFLKNGGYFGFVVSNAWLDVEYGAGLQEFFLKNYKIVAIIESKVERWFEDADINTCIVILEKASRPSKKTERDENLVRFVYLSKPLRHFIPPAQDIWEKQIERKQAIENLKKTILAHNKFYQNDEFRIFPKKQSELWEEGLDPEEQKYIGSKWGKYIRAPEIFFKVLEKGKDKLVKLGDLAQRIKRNNLENFRKWQILEKNFVGKSDQFPFLHSLKDTKSISINLSNLKSFQKTPSNKNTKYLVSDIISNRFVGERIFFIEGGDFLVNDSFFIAKLRDGINKKKVVLSINSTLSLFLLEIIGRKTYSIGVMYIYGPEFTNCLLVKPDLITKNIDKLYDKFTKREIKSIFEEIGGQSSQEISLDKIKPDRRALDQIVMGEILGLTEEEQLGVYRAVIDLVKSRIEKAKSFGSRKKTKSGIDIEVVVSTIVEKIDDKKLTDWYKKEILSRKDLQIKKLPELESKPQIEKSLFGWQIKNGKKAIECHSKDEARYLKVWLEVGAKSIKIPKDEKYLIEVTKELENRKLEIDDIIESYLGSILDQKLKSQILHQIWQKII